VKIIGLVLLGLLGLILFLLLAVLLIPFRCFIGYREKTETLTIKIKFLFLHLTLLPGRPEKKKKKRPKEEKPKKQKKKKKKTEDGEEKAAEKGKKKPDIKRLLPPLKKHIPKIFGCFRVSSLYILWHIHAEDAKDTAVRYGALSSICGAVLGMMDRYAKHLGKTSVDLFPDYEGTKDGFTGDITISLQIGALLVCFVRAIIDAVKMKII